VINREEFQRGKKKGEVLRKTKSAREKAVKRTTKGPTAVGEGEWASVYSSWESD